MNFFTVQSEGSLIAAETLAGIYHGEAPGQSAKDFGLDGKLRLSDEIAACWGQVRVHWASLQLHLQSLSESDSATQETRQLWVLPLLKLLGFERLTFARRADTVGGRTYLISHRDGAVAPMDSARPDSHAEPDVISPGLPIHIVGINQPLDRRAESGRPRLSPHALMQEYLNRTEHLWGIVTNGRRLRILRDAARMSKPTYLEFDLETMLQSEQFAEFQLLYRLLHRSRWPEDMSKAHDCWLEKYYQQGLDAGGRVREKLREGVEAALRLFGNGFLSHPDNTALREKLGSGQMTVTELQSDHFLVDFFRMLDNLFQS